MIATILLTVTLSLFPNDRPQLIHAQGIVESGLNKFAVGKDGERGAWQVISKYHGKVPKDMIGQLKQHITIMSGLHKETKGDIVKTVMRYNGKGKQAKTYYCKVRKKTFELQILGV